MKKLIYLLCFLPLLAGAQTTTYTITATSTSFDINGEIFSPGTVVLNIPAGDSTKAALLTADLSRVIARLTTLSSFKRSDGVAFANKTAFRAFYDSFMAGTFSPGVTAGGFLSGTYPSPIARATAGNGKLIGSHADSTRIRDVTVANNLSMSNDTLSFLPGLKVIKGTGTPLHSISAPVGSMYLRTDGVVDSVLYIKFTGTDSAGWYPLIH